jgi:hypothetical protein
LNESRSKPTSPPDLAAGAAQPSTALDRLSRGVDAAWSFKPVSHVPDPPGLNRIHRPAEIPVDRHHSPAPPAPVSPGTAPATLELVQAIASAIAQKQIDEHFPARLMAQLAPYGTYTETLAGTSVQPETELPLSELLAREFQLALDRCRQTTDRQADSDESRSGPNAPSSPRLASAWAHWLAAPPIRDNSLDDIVKAWSDVCRMVRSTHRETCP